MRGCQRAWTAAPPVRPTFTIALASAPPIPGPAAAAGAGGAAGRPAGTATGGDGGSAGGGSGVDGSVPSGAPAAGRVVASARRRHGGRPARCPRWPGPRQRTGSEGKRRTDRTPAGPRAEAAGLTRAAHAVAGADQPSNAVNELPDPETTTIAATIAAVRSGPSAMVACRHVRPPADSPPGAIGNTSAILSDLRVRYPVRSVRHATLGTRSVPDDGARSDPHRPGRDHPDAHELRLGQAERRPRRCDAGTPREAARFRRHQVQREQHAGPHAVAQLPEHPGEQAHRQRLVDRRRVDLRRRRHGPSG